MWTAVIEGTLGTQGLVLPGGEEELGKVSGRNCPRSSWDKAEKVFQEESAAGAKALGYARAMISAQLHGSKPLTLLLLYSVGPAERWASCPHGARGAV